MTAIVAVSQGTKMIFGGDSAATSDSGDLATIADEKVFRHGEFLFGCAGSPRALQLIKYVFEPPKRGKGDLDRYIVTSFMDSLRDVLMRGGHAVKKDNEETFGADVLVGYRGNLYVIYEDLGIEKVREPFNAIGSGATPALGALYATKKAGATRERVLTALRAAEAYNSGVRAPFTLITSEA